jgi:outer membrane protein TolC
LIHWRKALFISVRSLANSLAAIALVLGLAARAQSTNSSTTPLSLMASVQLALEHNLELQIERYVPEIARYNLGLASAEYEPALSAGGLHSFNLSPGGIDVQNRPFPGTSTDSDSFNAGLMGILPTGLSYRLGGNLSDSSGTSPGGPFENSSGSASVELRQPLLKNFWIDSTRLNIRVSKKRLTMSELALRLQIMSTVTSVELAYYDLILAKETVRVQEQALQTTQQLLTENKERVRVGIMAPFDEKQAESQVAARQADLLTAQRILATQQNVLKILLVDDTDAWRASPPEPTETLTATPQVFNLQESWQKGFTLRPDLLLARVDLERQGIVLKFLRNQLFPQVDLVGSYGHNASKREFSGAFDDLRRGNSPFHSYGAVMTVPLGNGNARNNLKTGKAEEKQLLLRLKQQELRIMAQIQDAVKLAETNFERIKATKQSRLFAETALEAEQKRLENARGSSFVVLQLQRELTAARSAEVQALAEYNRALAQLAFSEGTTLERHKLNLEVKE